MNILVAFFSAGGLTARLAKNLSEAANTDLFKIKPEKTYTKEDLDWTDKSNRSSIEYEVVSIGFPIW